MEAKRKVQISSPSLTTYAQVARTPSSSSDIKTVISELILPEIKKICESIIAERPERSLTTKGRSPFVPPQELTIHSAPSSTAATSATVKTASYNLPTSEKRKRKEAKSTSEISDADDEGAASSQASQGERGRTKQKPGWPKGKSRGRKPPAATQQDVSSGNR